MSCLRGFCRCAAYLQESWLRGGSSCSHKERGARDDVRSEGRAEARLAQKRMAAGLEWLQSGCGSSHAFWSPRRETVVDALARLKMSWGFATTFGQHFFRHCIQKVDNYQISRQVAVRSITRVRWRWSSALSPSIEAAVVVQVTGVYVPAQREGTFVG